MKKVIIMTALAVLFIATSCQKPNATKAQKPILNKYLEASNTKVNPGHLNETLELNIAQFVTSIYLLDFAGIDSLKKGIVNLINMYPDFNVIVEDEIYAHNNSSIHFTWTGTFTNPDNLYTNPNEVELTGFDFLSFNNGKIPSNWRVAKYLVHEGQPVYTPAPILAETREPGSK